MPGNLRRLWRRLGQAVRPGRAETELARELASHLALIEDELVRRGMSPAAARREARLQLGVEATRHAHRDARSFRWIDELAVDVKYALRRLVARPGTTVLAAVMLALAVGLSTAMFSIVDAMVLRPLPFPHADRLIGLYMGTETGGDTRVSREVRSAWRTSPGFEQIEFFITRDEVVDTAAGPVARPVAAVTPGLFDLLGVRPLAGRLFHEGDADREAVLISEGLWRTAFEGVPDIVGREIRIGHESRTVVGVLPDWFRFPDRSTSVWLPGEHTDARMVPVARLAGDIPRGEALRIATALAHEADPTTSDRHARERPLLMQAGTYRERAVVLLGGGVVLVVLALCVNVSSVLLTGLRVRRRELAMSVALGASSGRLARQALVESLLLGAVGVAAGLTVAWALVRTAQVLLPQAFVRASLNTIDLDLRALGAAAVAGLAATLLAGLVPVWLAGRVAGPSADALVKERSATGTRAARATSRVLLVTEVALACVLLAGASVLVRSFANVAGIDRGFDPTGLVTLTFSFDESGLTGREPRLAAAEEARRAIQALPGVTDTAWSAGQGIGFGPWTSDVPGSQPQRFEVQGTAVSPQYFGLHDITFQNGRAFDGRDGAHAAVVGDTIARRLWGDDVPLGRFIEWAGERHLIVGVVSEPRQSVVDSDLEYADLYVPFSGPGPYPTLSLRCIGTCPSEGLFRQATNDLGSIGLWQVNYLDEERTRDLEQPRAAAALVATFALVALLAAAGGLFGVVSYSVLERRREFGIRSALGAAPGDISRVVYREGVLVGLIGLVTGGALAAAASSTLASLSYEASLADPTGLLVVGLTIALTIVAALWHPARTAARTDPAMLLREE